MAHSYAHLEPHQIGSAIKAFRSEQCPGCNEEKPPSMESFCRGCFDHLPAELQARLTKRATFIEAFHPAMDILLEKRSLKQVVLPVAAATPSSI